MASRARFAQGKHRVGYIRSSTHLTHLSRAGVLGGATRGIGSGSLTLRMIVQKVGPSF